MTIKFTSRRLQYAQGTALATCHYGAGSATRGLASRVQCELEKWPALLEACGAYGMGRSPDGPAACGAKSWHSQRRHSAVTSAVPYHYSAGDPQ